MSEEKQLTRALKSGDIQIINAFFEQIYKKYKGLICFIIAKYIDLKEDVMDIAQDVFLSFFNNADNIRSNIKYYLTTSARNKALNHLKKNNKTSLIEVDKIDLLDEKIDDQSYLFNDIILILKNNLKEIEYKILLMHLIDEYTFKELSMKLGIKESSIKSIYFRTLEKAKVLLERRKSNAK